MKLVFMGTPAFAVPALDALVAAGHELVAVYTQPPRAAGRGHRAQPSAVQTRAAAHDLPLRTPKSLKPTDEHDRFRALDADAAVVVAYGLILPPPILAAPRRGCLNIHASLLPRWRGAAPIQHAIWAGDEETGITIIMMDEGLDTGPMLLRESVAIDERTTAATLHDRLATLGARLIVDTLDRLARGALVPEAQDDSAATYARKLTRADGWLDWTRSAAELARQIRALTPWPGTWFELEGERVRVIEAVVSGATRNGAEPPGTVVTAEGLFVRCGDGATLRLATVQRPGKRPVSDTAFRNGLRQDGILVLG